MEMWSSNINDSTLILMNDCKNNESYKKSLSEDLSVHRIHDKKFNKLP